MEQENRLLVLIDPCHAKFLGLTMIYIVLFKYGQSIQENLVALSNDNWVFWEESVSIMNALSDQKSLSAGRKKLDGKAWILKWLLTAVYAPIFHPLYDILSLRISVNLQLKKMDIPRDPTSSFFPTQSRLIHF